MHRDHHSYKRTSNPEGINSMYRKCKQVWKTCLKNKSKAFKDGCISSKFQEWENITSDKETLKNVQRLTLDFEQEP